MMKEKQKVLAKHGIEVEDESAGEILEMERSSGVALRRTITEKELIYLNQDWKYQNCQLE
jgi:hypothetical protein